MAKNSRHQQASGLSIGKSGSQLHETVSSHATTESKRGGGYRVHTSPDQLQNNEYSPPSPPSLGGIRFQSPPELTSDPAEFVIRKGIVRFIRERARKGI